MKMRTELVTAGTVASRRFEGQIIGAGAALLASSVLADSAMEHYRGSFANPAMPVPLAASAASLTINGLRAFDAGAGPAAVLVHVIVTAAGASGLAFHVYNVAKQPGGFILNNLFYKAPLGAPGALMLAGTLGIAADRLVTGHLSVGPLAIGSGRFLAGYTAFGLLGTVAEAGLLHFRGAFHNPAMWAPVVLPPISAALLLRAALARKASPLGAALLGATAVMGLVGAAFHAHGVQRNMGGWKNWRQNLLSGPPLPAPPSFTGLAIAGIAALRLIRRFAHD